MNHLHVQKLSSEGIRNRTQRARLAGKAALSVALCLACCAVHAEARTAQNAQPAAQTNAAQPAAAQPSASQAAPAKPRPAAPAAKQEATPPSPKGISYSTTTNRTGVWIGDQFHYVITVDYSSDFEFVLDNLNKDNVNMDPFPVIDVQKTVTPYGNNRSRLVVDMTLANLSLAQVDAKIPQITLYYFRRDQRTGGAEQAAAESLSIVGPMIALRSMLPANPTDIRDGITTAGWQSSRWIVPALGYAALALLLGWLGWEAFAFVKKRRTQQGPDRSVSMETVRNRWARAVPSDFSDGKMAKDFLDRSYLDVKEYLGYYLNTDAVSLTADEVQEELQRSGASSDVTRKAAKVLTTCEVARYSSNGTTATPETARGIAQDVRELLNLAPKD